MLAGMGQSSGTGVPGEGGAVGFDLDALLRGNI